VDAVSIAEFASKERDNLYKLWNPMSSGSYFPGPVRAVEIPKDHGAGTRTLGVPNTVDRVAQTAAAMLLRRKAGADLPPGQLRLSSGPLGP
jgi:retron-type reverse transcriptase